MRAGGLVQRRGTGDWGTAASEWEGSPACPTRHAQRTFLGGHRDTPDPKDSWTKQRSWPAQPTRGIELNCNLDNEGASAFLSLMQSNKLPRFAEKPACPPTRPLASCPSGLRQHMSVTIRRRQSARITPHTNVTGLQAGGAGVPAPSLCSSSSLAWQRGSALVSLSPPTSCLFNHVPPPLPTASFLAPSSVVFPP